MKKSNRPDRDISNYHEILPKEERPELGKRYILNMNDEATCVADIAEFDGGCWAKVRVVAPAAEKYASVYKEDMTFDIKVAYYKFQELPADATEQSQNSEAQGSTEVEAQP